MQQHVLATIADLEFKIISLHQTICHLKSTFGDPASTLICETGTATITKPAALNSLLPIRPIRPISPKPSKPSKQPKPSHKQPRPLKHDYSQIVVAGSNLPTPFDIDDITTSLAGVFTRQQVRDKVGYMTKIGIFKIVIPGGPGKPAKLRLAANHAPPSTATTLNAPPRPPIPTRAILETKLTDALKQRDYARENGRTEVVAIFQKEIDTIESQLAAIK